MPDNNYLIKNLLEYWGFLSMSRFVTLILNTVKTIGFEAIKIWLHWLQILRLWWVL